MKTKIKYFLFGLMTLLAMSITTTTVKASTGSAEQEAEWQKLADWKHYYIADMTKGANALNVYPLHFNKESNTLVTTVSEKRAICNQLLSEGYVCVKGRDMTITNEEQAKYFEILDMFAYHSTYPYDMYISSETWSIFLDNYTTEEEEASIIANGTIPTKLKREDLAELLFYRYYAYYEELLQYDLSGNTTTPSSETLTDSNNTDNNETSKTHTSADKLNDKSDDTLNDTLDDKSNDKADKNDDKNILPFIICGIFIILILLILIFLSAKKKRG